MNKFFFLLIAFYFSALAYFVFTANYLLTDETYLLWHNRDDGVIFNMFFTQGRYLTGILFEFLFKKFDNIEKIKIIRFISLSGWTITIVFIFIMIKKCLKKIIIKPTEPFIYSSIFFIAASLTVTVCISWAACAEIFISTLAAFYSGYSLFICLQPQNNHINIPLKSYLLVIGEAFISLFLYQSSYPLMLFPFFILFLFKREKNSYIKIKIEFIFHFVIYGLYYLLNASLIKNAQIIASNRTELQFSPLNKLAFFFSFPLNQAFNINFPFDSKSLASQLIFPLLACGWILFFFIRYKEKKLIDNLNYILVILLFWIISFLPQLITKENFGPYRTMLPLSLLVFATLTETIYYFIKIEKRKIFCSFFSGIILLINGVFNYYHFIAKPLSFEFSLIKSFIEKKYSVNINRIIIVRPQENGFEKTLGITNYKDELGMPSTSKDWVSEPLVKQILFEKAINKNTLHSLQIIQFTNENEVKKEDTLNGNTLVINIPEILKTK